MQKVLSVSDFLTLVNETLRLIPSDAYVVEGEISDYRVNQGKWVTFDLKDETEEAKVSCFAVLFKIGIPVENGMRVRITGSAKVFERFGKFTLNVDEILPVGEGALQKAYLALKKKLTEEGIFDASRKRAIPSLPLTIGLITSKDAAAYGDFLRVLSNRFGGLLIIHANTHVQGQNAVPEIVEAFRSFNALKEDEAPEVIVLTRGGGGLEDLHAFNDERVVRAIFSSRIPVVVGVGHERDETLCDFVADLRASTPSNAAERLVPHREDVMRGLQFSVDRMSYRLDEVLSRARQAGERAGRMFERVLTSSRTRLEAVTLRLDQAYRFRFERTRQQIGTFERVLTSVDPARVLKRGYAIVRKGGKVFTGGEQLAARTRLSVQLAHDSLLVETVTEGQSQLL